MLSNLIAGFKAAPWLIAAGLLVGLSLGFTVGRWSVGWRAAEAHQASADCQAGRADANAAAAQTTGEIRKDMTPIVQELNSEVERLRAALEEAGREIENDPRPVCLATSDDVARMRRLAEGDGNPGDRPPPR